MKTREKAIELYNKFRNENSVMTANIRAKKQAIICVNEIIKALKTTTGHCTLSLLDRQEVQSDFEYWDDVLEEIKNNF